MGDGLSASAVLIATPSIPDGAAGSSSNQRYVPELDGLRAVAIFSVLCCHYLPESLPINRLQRSLQQGHAFGVPLFFALSGFLITRILMQSRAMVDSGHTTSAHSLYIFYARRVLRIFPIYYTTLFIGVLFRYSNVHAALPWHLAYLSNIYYFHRGFWDKGPAPVFWTLSVEEQFYLIWPLIFLLLPTRRLPAITLATAVIGAVFAAWASDSDMTSLLLPAQMMFLAVGSYLGLAGVAPLGSPRRLARVMRLFVVMVPIFIVVAAAVRYAVPESRLQLQIASGFRYVATALCFGWIVSRLSQGVGGLVGRFLRWGPVTYIGRISYGMYILQFFVTHMMDRETPRLAAHIGTGPASIILQSFSAQVIAIIIVASISWLCLERPLNNLKRYFPYPRNIARGLARSES